MGNDGRAGIGRKTFALRCCGRHDGRVGIERNAFVCCCVQAAGGMTESAARDGGCE
ncbi:MAG: hypothetical protein HFI58_02900 [Lachnospiraceae bacterium]|nr:hypothetical protein [Lachnospiraceae bacterium]MCI8985093.1 hypothetical protein [Lachnospiraceae bacterium]MCI9013005.1 hypothetical protein [Lachnospiraceae bacterium]MCI9253777.1 hypothetical protein [Lachnospiraceae bacterium]